MVYRVWLSPDTRKGLVEGRREQSAAIWPSRFAYAGG